MQQRTIHGGSDSALSVEVSAVRFGGGETAVCNHEPERADAIAVYIRNPLAMWVRDFLTANGCEKLGISEYDADRLGRGPGEHGSRTPKGAAFEFGDALAEHLGCAVVSHLKREG